MLIQAGWNEQQWVSLLCPLPLARNLDLFHFYPLWATHHQQALVEVMEEVMSEVPAQLDEVRRHRYIWEGLAHVGLDRHFWNHYLDQPPHHQLDSAVTGMIIGWAANPPLVQHWLHLCAHPQGLDSLAPALPDKLLGFYRVLEEAFGGRPAPVDTPPPLIWPSSEIRNLKEMDFSFNNGSEQFSAQRLLDVQNHYLAASERQILRSQLSFNAPAKPRKM